MKSISGLWLLLLISSPLLAQQNALKGNVMDEKGQPLPYVTAALLHPKDSTLAFFGISNTEGNFEIKGVSAGDYLLQLACIGFKTKFLSVPFPFPNTNDLETIVMETSPVNLNGVEVKAERVPLQLRGDTIVYDAGAYKTQPDASTEDLLKKLPGVEVDQAGNIKAQGENVNQVLVDGKEFFSSDPKVATKNLPADAVNKVQVFDKKSDEADFTGIDDGSRSKTINLLLKDDKKSAWFGDTQAGYGTENHYLTNAKIYRFTHTDQFAALGMLNNINQFGFSFRDYIDFNGGIGSLMHGSGGMRIESGGEEDLPIDFGQPITGLITSGAGGLNYTHEAKPGNRINISYLANGSDKHLIQNTSTQNFTPDYSFTGTSDLDQTTKNFANHLNIIFRNRLDSTQSIFANGTASLTGKNSDGNTYTQNFSADSLTNTLTNNTLDHTSGVRGTAAVNYIKKGKSNWRVFKAGLNFSGFTSLSETQWKNVTQLFSPNEILHDDQYQNTHNHQVNLSGSISALRKLSGKYYFEPLIKFGGTNEVLNREQGIPSTDNIQIDSLSPDFLRSNQWLQPAIGLKYSTEKTQWRISLGAREISLRNSLNGAASQKSTYYYFIPQFSFEKELKRGQNLRIYYDSQVNSPDAIQLLPVENSINPIELYSGNKNLKPEYAHNLYFNWMLFDQFSFTSVFTNFTFGYTKDKIAWSRTINPDLTQSITLVNVPSDYTASAGIDFSTPIRFLKLNFHTGIDERYNRGTSFVNDVPNTLNNFSHQLSMSFDNRKKEKWDVSFGGRAELSSAAYSVQSEMNNQYFNWSYFTEIHFNPSDHWRFSFYADVSHYTSQSFSQNIDVPLLRAEVVRYFLKANRGVITLSGFDLLNKNSGVERISELNYLQQTQSNIIGRYFMLSFKFRINKFDAGNGGIDLKVNGR